MEKVFTIAVQKIEMKNNTFSAIFPRVDYITHNKKRRDSYQNTIINLSNKEGLMFCFARNRGRKRRGFMRWASYDDMKSPTFTK